MKIVKRMDKKMCETFTCPAIMEAENGDIIVIGTDVTNEVENLTDFNAGCAPYEKIVRIPKAVFESIFNKND